MKLFLIVSLASILAAAVLFLASTRAISLERTKPSQVNLKAEH